MPGGAWPISGCQLFCVFNAVTAQRNINCIDNVVQLVGSKWHGDSSVGAVPMRAFVGVALAAKGLQVVDLVRAAMGMGPYVVNLQKLG